MWTKDRYYDSVNYNMVRVFGELARIIKKNGGDVECPGEPLRIHTRGYHEKIMDVSQRQSNALRELGLCDDPERRKICQERVERLEKELSETVNLQYEAPVVETRFVTLISDLSIHFFIGGYMYYFSVDNNPFFPDRYTKKLIGRAVTVYSDQLSKDGWKPYLLDELFQPVASEKAIETSAQALYDSLMAAEESKCCEKWFRDRKTFADSK